MEADIGWRLDWKTKHGFITPLLADFWEKETEGGYPVACCGADSFGQYCGRNLRYA